MKRLLWIAASVVALIVAVVAFTLFEQAGTSLNLYAERSPSLETAQ